jgi:hypothetical protein
VQANNGVSPAATAGPFNVSIGPAATLTTLTLGATATYGSEKSDVLNVKVATAVPSSLGPPGTVAVTDGGSPVCTITLKSNGTGTCKLTATQLATGQHVLTATYTPGNASYAASASTPVQLTVAPPATSVTFTPPASLTFGSEQSGKFTVKVSAGGAPLSGTVTVLWGPLTLCAAPVSTSGSATCKVTSAQLPVGSYDLDAVFTPGSENLLPSTSATKVMMVVAAATTTTLKLKAAISYGAENASPFTAKVTASGLAPAGTVAIKAGSVTLCTFTVGGSGSCALGATQLPAGSYLVQAVYTPANDSTKTSSSATAVLTVNAAKTSTSLTFTSSASYGSEQLSPFKVAVTATGVTPAGTVEVMSGTTTLCTATLTSGQASCALSGSQLPVGTHPVDAVYVPADANVGGSASTTKSLRIK